MPQREVLVIVPAHNEAGSIAAVLAELREQASDCDVVVVNDGSTDGTAAVARAAGAPVIELSFNLGIGGAVQAGFKYAVERGYRIAVQFDGDGQHGRQRVRLVVGRHDDEHAVAGHGDASAAGFTKRVREKTASSEMLAGK